MRDENREIKKREPGIVDRVVGVRIVLKLPHERRRQQNQCPEKKQIEHHADRRGVLLCPVMDQKSRDHGGGERQNGNAP